MIEHNHKINASLHLKTYKPNCPKCKLNDAAEETAAHRDKLLAACKSIVEHYNNCPVGCCSLCDENDKKLKAAIDNKE